MFYYLYQITNKVNNKIYVGVHKTHNMEDGYMGSGKVIISAINKYGMDNFKKDILETFDNVEAMYAREKEVVSDDFLSREDTYNLRRGGSGGFDYINKNNLNGFSDQEVAKLGRKITNQKLEQKYGPNWRSILNAKGLEKRVKVFKEKLINSSEFRQKVVENALNASNHALSHESQEKRKQTFRKTGHQVGIKNNQFGKVWITNGIESKMIPGHQKIESGWNRGRTLPNTK